MKILIGLGNPGKEFTSTRHNVGFEFIKNFSRQHEIVIDRERFNCLLGKGRIEKEEIILVFPFTFMNLTGSAVKLLSSKFEVKPKNILVISDDINLNLGVIRIREGGSAGGHNGLKSIITSLNSQDFPRLRIGIGPKPPKKDLSDFVLENFKKSEIKIIDECLNMAVMAAYSWITEGTEEAMRKFNGLKNIRS